MKRLFGIGLCALGLVFNVFAIFLPAMMAYLSPAHATDVAMYWRTLAMCIFCIPASFFSMHCGIGLTQ